MRLYLIAASVIAAIVVGLWIKSAYLGAKVERSEARAVKAEAESKAARFEANITDLVANITRGDEDDENRSDVVTGTFAF